MSHPEHMMNSPVSTPDRSAPQGRGLTAIDGAMALVAVLVIVQMWLLTTTLQLGLAGHHGAATPALILSGLLFAGCFGLYLLVDRIDADVRGSSRQPAAGPPGTP